MMGDVLMSVEVETEGEFSYKAPVRLFRLDGMRGNFPEEAPWLAKYDVSPDGGKFVLVRTVGK